MVHAGTGEGSWLNGGYIYIWAGKNDRRVSGGLSFVVWDITTTCRRCVWQDLSLRVISGSILIRKHSPISASCFSDDIHHVLPPPSRVLFSSFSQDPPSKIFISGPLPETPLWSAFLRFSPLTPTSIPALAPYPQRTHTCGSISAKDAGSRVVLTGWISSERQDRRIILSRVFYVHRKIFLPGG